MPPRNLQNRLILSMQHVKKYDGKKRPRKTIYGKHGLSCIFRSYCFGMVKKVVCFPDAVIKTFVDVVAGSAILCFFVSFLLIQRRHFLHVDFFVKALMHMAVAALAADDLDILLRRKLAFHGQIVGGFSAAKCKKQQDQQKKNNLSVQHMIPFISSLFIEKLYECNLFHT